MRLIYPIVYSPPWFLFNAHAETIYPSLFRRVELGNYKRERIETPDNDFIDLDWLAEGSEKLVIISHGLEGNSKRAYMKGMARAFYSKNYDVLCWNYRGCSEEMNKTIRFYHSGATDDLALVIDHSISKGYKHIFLIGFSLGGNLTLKYSGERIPDGHVKAVVTFSVPLNLHTSCLQISQPSNWIYSRRFLRNLEKKVKKKSKIMGGLDIRGIDQIKTLMDFDDRYTAPLHGFKNAVDYYEQCSAINFLETVRLPTLLVNAKNDPFLSRDCYPENIKNFLVKTEYPEHGGHVGFTSINGNGLYWSEQRALDFITSLHL